MTYIRITNWVLQTAAEWTASLQVLHTWEAGIESDTGKVKRGNGLDVYSALSYLPGFGAGGGGGDMLAANNLSDVASIPTARANLMPSYASNALKVLRVNAGETDVEFITLAGGGDMLAANNLSDVANTVTARNNILPSKTGNSLKFLRVNAGETDYELAVETDPVYTAWYNSGDPTLDSIVGSGGGLIDLANADVRLQGTAGNYIWLVYESGGSAAQLDMSALTVNRKFLFPDQAGTFALLSDLSSFITSETDPVFTAWLGTNDYLSSSTTSVQDGYFNSINLKDQQTPSHYLHITVEDNLTATRNLEINVADGNKLLVISGNADISGNHSGNSSGTNTGDQTSIVGITGTKAQFDTACTDGNFLYVGDITQYTDELAQDAIGAMVDSTLVYVDATPLLTRAALTGDVTAAQGSNATTIANDAVTFAKFQNITDARLLGRSAGSSGDMQEITVGAGLTLSGGALTSSGFSQVVWQVFTAPGSGTYTPTSGMKYCVVIVTGGGGASLDCTNTDAVTGGGGAGGTAIKVYSAAAIGASKPYVVGAGGLRDIVQTQGTASTFDSGSMTANGGFSSAVQLAGATVNVGYGGTGGNATGGDINIDGGSGTPGIIVSTTLGVGGTGGSSYWGGGRCAVGSDTVGLAGICYGSGAAGAHAAGTTDRQGANGAPGVVVIIEYI